MFARYARRLKCVFLGRVHLIQFTATAESVGDETPSFRSFANIALPRRFGIFFLLLALLSASLATGG
jgi:hypothetical protein